MVGGLRIFRPFHFHIYIEVRSEKIVVGSPPKQYFHPKSGSKCHAWQSLRKAPKGRKVVQLRSNVHTKVVETEGLIARTCTTRFQLQGWTKRRVPLSTSALQDCGFSWLHPEVRQALNEVPYRGHEQWRYDQWHQWRHWILSKRAEFEGPHINFSVSEWVAWCHNSHATYLTWT